MCTYILFAIAALALLLTWQPTDVAAASQAVKEGRIGDAYRDVVREYFQPQGSP